MVEGSIRNIINIIENPEQTTDQELSYLFNLSIKHPYSGFCHLIIAKTLHKQNRTGFNNVLRKAALTNVDRSILHKYIHQDEKKEANKNLENKHVTLPTDEDEQFLEKNVISNLIENQLTEELENIEENQVEKTNIAPLPTVDENTVMRFEDWLTKNKQKKGRSQPCPRQVWLKKLDGPPRISYRTHLINVSGVCIQLRLQSCLQLCFQLGFNYAFCDEM